MKTKLFLTIISVLFGWSVNAQIMFQKTYGGDSSDYSQSVIQTSDGGYMIGGVTKSFGAGEFDICLNKVNAQGNMEWNTVIGDSLDDFAFQCFRLTMGAI